METILGIKLETHQFRVVMINTNFSMNATVDLSKVIAVLEKDFIVSFNPDRYSAVKVKFQPAPNTKQVTASIFSTGKIIVTGAETLREIALAYEVLNEKLQSAKLEPTKEETFNVIKGFKFDEMVQYLRASGIERFS
jgi:hypothetical protein